MTHGNKILIVMAAGSGTRMGSATPKQFLDLGGKPVLRRTIETFVSAIPDIKVITVLPKEHISFWKEYCLSSEFTCPQLLVSGGITRFHSVRNALERVPDGAIVVPSVDTLKVLDTVQSDLGERIIKDSGEGIDRSRVFGAQTPQMFLSEDIKDAYSQAFDTSFTDDASVVSKKGIPLSFCAGERYNFKLTSPEDLSLARMITSSLSR